MWGGHSPHPIKSHQKGRGCGAGGQPDPRAGSRDAGAGGIPFLKMFDDLFDDFVWGLPPIDFLWGGGYPP